MSAERKRGLSKFVQFGVIDGDPVGVTHNVRNGKEPIINVVKKHKPVVKETSFRTVNNSTMTRLTSDNFDAVSEAEEFLKVQGLDTY